jgi:hypothetical protein
MNGFNRTFDQWYIPKLNLLNLRDPTSHSLEEVGDDLSLGTLWSWLLLFEEQDFESIAMHIN